MGLIKNKFFLIFIICISITAKAYSGDSTKLNKTNRYIIGVSVGAAMPFLHFGTPSSAPSESQYDSSYYGYAKIGFHYAINIEVLVAPHVALTGQISGNFNSFNTTVYNNTILYNEANTASVKANTYYTGEYMVGLLFYCPLLGTNSNLSLTFSIMAGYSMLNFPTIVTTYSATSTQLPGESSLSANSANSLVMNFGMGLRDKINKRIVVSLDFPFSFAYMKFSSGVYTETIQGTPSITTVPGNPMDMWIGLFKPALGVGYIF